MYFRHLVGVALLLPLLYLVHGQSVVYDVVSPGSLLPGQPIPAPRAAVVLTVRGRLGRPHASEGVTFDLPTLEKIGMVRFTTPTAWTNTPVTFEGILVSRLLDLLAVPQDASTARMTALNDYEVTIPLEEFRKWPVMLAMKRNGALMSVRDKGPLWIVYPRHAFPELTDTPKQQSHWIWQLKDMLIR